GMRFREVHTRLYGYATDEHFLVESLRIEASVARDERQAPVAASGRKAEKPFKTSQCCFHPGGLVETPRFDRESFEPGRTVSGPCIIEDAWSTVVLQPGSRCRKDDAGHLHIEV